MGHERAVKQALVVKELEKFHDTCVKRAGMLRRYLKGEEPINEHAIERMREVVLQVNQSHHVIGVLLAEHDDLLAGLKAVAELKAENARVVASVRSDLTTIRDWIPF